MNVGGLTGCPGSEMRGDIWCRGRGGRRGGGHLPWEEDKGICVALEYGKSTHEKFTENNNKLRYVCERRRGRNTRIILL